MVGVRLGPFLGQAPLTYTRVGNVGEERRAGEGGAARRVAWVHQWVAHVRETRSTLQSPLFLVSVPFATRVPRGPGAVIRADAVEGLCNVLLHRWAVAAGAPPPSPLLPSPSIPSRVRVIL